EGWRMLRTQRERKDVVVRVPGAFIPGRCGVGAEEKQGDELAPGRDAAGRPELPGPELPVLGVPRLLVAALQRLGALLQLGRVAGARLVGVGLDGLEPGEPAEVGNHLGEQGAAARVVAGRLAEPGP